MTAKIIALTCAYAAVLLLLVGLLLRTSLHWRLKAVAVVGSGLLALMVYEGLEDVWGWPVEKAPPLGARYVASEVLEPNRKTGHPGAVYIWAIPQGDTQPRAYEIPYEPSTHKEMADADERIRATGRQQITQRQAPSDGQQAADQPGVRIVDKPVRRLPGKG